MIPIITVTANAFPKDIAATNFSWDEWTYI